MVTIEENTREALKSRPSQKLNAQQEHNGYRRYHPETNPTPDIAPYPPRFHVEVKKRRLAQLILKRVVFSGPAVYQVFSEPIRDLAPRKQLCVSSSAAPLSIPASYRSTTIRTVDFSPILTTLRDVLMLFPVSTKRAEFLYRAPATLAKLGTKIASACGSMSQRLCIPHAKCSPDDHNRGDQRIAHTHRRLIGNTKEISYSHHVHGVIPSHDEAQRADDVDDAEGNEDSRSNSSFRIFPMMLPIP